MTLNVGSSSNSAACLQPGNLDTWRSRMIGGDTCHQQAQFGFGCFGSDFAGDLAVEHDKDPVGQRPDLVELNRDEQDSLAFLPQRDEPAVNKLDGADIDAAGRLAHKYGTRI